MRRFVVSEAIVDKVLTVTSVNVVTELATGDLAYQVTFGYYAKNTPELINRIPANIREPFMMSKNIAINEITLLIKVDEVPYKVGSKWKMKISNKGTLNMVEVR
jgi:hypothetical protein